MTSVQALLEDVGMLRLRVRNPLIKALLTHVSWSGERYLRQQANGSEPAGGQIVPFVDQLETLVRVVERHVALERITDYSREKQKQLNDSLRAIVQFARSVNPQQHSTVNTIMSDVDLALLIRNTPHN